ncbi:DUF2750 domain-containing protein [Stutzerimonas tarimensis]|uniref:DUF2750 domain-containing protein n=1 Tax=Stutzerimonas tarimensis TaxID=1507735 RepID=A0ABV7T102_9GAMM
MRYTPTESEYAAVPRMSDGERLDYFLTRVFETDEVWFLKNPMRPFERSLGGTIYLPVWPYRRFASEAALEQWQDCVPSSVSLDHYLEIMLAEQVSPGALIEIMPRGEAAGCVITPVRLRSILEAMIDVGSYHLDG